MEKTKGLHLEDLMMMMMMLMMMMMMMMMVMMMLYESKSPSAPPLHAVQAGAT